MGGGGGYAHSDLPNLRERGAEDVKPPPHQNSTGSGTSEKRCEICTEREAFGSDGHPGTGPHIKNAI